MKLTKSIEIIELNINIAGPKMPADCLDALKVNLEAAKRIQDGRAKGYDYFGHLLPGETDENAA